MSAPRIVLGVTGGIAAYKSAEVVRGLTQAGAEVRVIMTPAATKFLAPLTLSVLSRHPVIADLWDPGSGAVDHVELARWADVLCIAPATADALAKLAGGHGDDVLSTYALAHRGALVLAPAMNTWMWAHPATVANLALLKERGARVVEPDAGDLACGDVGPGRLAPPERVVAAALAAARSSNELAGRTVVVTAGPTREPIDPVRYLSNRSSGKMGFALAREARRRGAEVVLIRGPVALDAPAGVRVVKVERTAEMRDAVLAALPAADVLLMAAAPADFTAAEPSDRKLKRGDGVPVVALAPAPDILQAVAGSGSRKPGLLVVAFAAETHELRENALKKLRDKRADLLVANDVSRAGIGFDAEENEVVILTRTGEDTVAEEAVPRASKGAIAATILDRVTALLGNA